MRCEANVLRCFFAISTWHGLCAVRSCALQLLARAERKALRLLAQQVDLQARTRSQHNRAYCQQQKNDILVSSVWTQSLQGKVLDDSLILLRSISNCDLGPETWSWCQQPTLPAAKLTHVTQAADWHHLAFCLGTGFVSNFVLCLQVLCPQQLPRSWWQIGAQMAAHTSHVKPTALHRHPSGEKGHAKVPETPHSTGYTLHPSARSEPPETREGKVNADIMHHPSGRHTCPCPVTA